MCQYALLMQYLYPSTAHDQYTSKDDQTQDYVGNFIQVIDPIEIILWLYTFREEV